MKRIIVLLTSILLLQNIFAQSDEDKWYYGLYRNESGQEFIIFNQNVVFLNEEEGFSFCTYVEGNPNTILAVYDELDIEFGIIVVDKEHDTASRTWDYNVEYSSDFSSETHVLKDNPKMDAYSKVARLGPVTKEKIFYAKEQRKAVLNNRKEQISQLISNNKWMIGEWVSSSGDTCLVVTPACIFYGYAGDINDDYPPIRFEEGRFLIDDYPSIEFEEGGCSVSFSPPNEDYAIIDLQRKTIKTDFYGTLKKVTP